MAPGRSLVDVDDLSNAEVEHILGTATRYAGDSGRPRTTNDLAGHIIATCFFEPSTRTRLSFEAAAHRLGADAIGFADAKATSGAKGETLEDTARVMAGYADLLVVRHPEPGAAKRVADSVDIPVINAGDGAHAHPTQALVDLYTINQERGRPGDHHVTLLGDLKNGRTVHSLAVLLARFGNRITCVAPDDLQMPTEVLDACEAHGPRPETASLEEALPDSDVLYVTRVQQERFPTRAAYEAVKGSYIIDPQRLQGAKKDLTILHPLPRVDELTPEVDTHPGAAYFRQARNGVPVRMALLHTFLKESST